jgi:hypothetical protein
VAATPAATPPEQWRGGDQDAAGLAVGEALLFSVSPMGMSVVTSTMILLVPMWRLAHATLPVLHSGRSGSVGSLGARRRCRRRADGPADTRVAGEALAF